MLFSLRLALVFSLLYPAVRGWLDPYAWVGYFPPSISMSVSDPITLLHVFGVIEIILALWILSNKKIFIPCAATVVMLSGIIFFNFSQIDILFRDIPILVIAGVLAWNTTKRA